MATYYVSATLANGIPAGNDVTGDGSAAKPWASIEQALGAARDGDTVMLNDGVYTPAGDLRITNAVSIQAVKDYGATIRGAAGETRVLTIGEDQGGTVTLGKIVIDAANTVTSDITLTTLNVPFTLNLNGTQLLNATRFGIQGSSTGTRVNLNMTGVNFSGATADTMVYLPALAEGNVTIQGGRVDLPGQDQSGYGGIATIDGSAPGPQVTISGVTAKINATGGAGIHYGVRLRDISGSLIEYNDVTLTGGSTDYIGTDVSVSYDRLGGLDSSNGVIRFNTLRDYMPGGAGKIILVGADSDPGVDLRNTANNFEIYGNHGYGNAASQASTLHGILVGWQTGAKVYDNSMDFTALAYVMKGMQGDTEVYDNLDTHTTGKSYYQKGGADVQFVHNTSYQVTGYSPYGVVIGDIGVGQYPATGAQVVGNTIAYQGQSGTFVAVSPGSTTTQIAKDRYYLGGAYNLQPFIYQNTVYANEPDWKTYVEPTAGKSGWTSAPTPSGALGLLSLSGQPLANSGVINGVQTYTLTFVQGQASTASFAIANFSDSGVASLTGSLAVTSTDAPISGKVLTGTGVTSGSFGTLAAGGSVSRTVTYNGAAAVGGEVVRLTGTAGQAVNLVIKTVALAAPVISGVTAKTANDNQTVAPFSGLVLAEGDKTRTQTVKVTLSNAANGRFTTLAGFTDLGGGVYSFSGTASAIQTALRGLRFTPTANQVANGQTVQTGFTITYADAGYTITDSTAKVTATSVNDTPVLTTVPKVSILETDAAKIFAGATLLDGDLGQTQTVRVSMGVGHGTLTNLGGFVDNGDGSYSFTGAASAAQAALRGLVYNPVQHAVAPGSSFIVKMALTTSDGVAAQQSAVEYVTVTAVNGVPLLSGTGTSTVTSNQVVKPFAAVTVNDPDKAPSETTVVRLDDPAKGSFTTLAGFVKQADGSYSFTGSPAATQSALRALVFTPTPGRLTYGATETVQFTIALSDGLQSITDSATVVTITSAAANTAPTLSGLPTNQTVIETQLLQPFTGATLVDPDVVQTQTATILLDSATHGALGNLAGWTGNADGSYSTSGSAAAVTAALRGVTFDPADHLSVPGGSVTAKLTVTLSDGTAVPQNMATYVAIQSVNTAPVLAGTVAGSTIDKQAVNPFAAVTVTDLDKGAAETVTVRLDDAAKGKFTTLGSFTKQADGSLTYAGSPAAVQSALRTLVFTPTAGRLALNASEIAAFTVTMTDGTATVTDSKTQITIKGSTGNTAPGFTGLVASQSTTEPQSLSPFAAVSVADPDAGQVQTIKVALDSASRGSFSNLGGFIDNGNGSYSFTGSASAATTALRGLVFTPALYQSAPGSSSTATLTLTVDDGLSGPQSGTAAIVMTAVETPPAVGGTAASAIDSSQTISPFASATITDPDKGAAETVTVQIDNPAKGSFTTLAGFVKQSDGSYSFSGTPAAAQAALRGLVFTPAAGRLTYGASEVATFTVGVSDGLASVADSTTRVTVTNTKFDTPPSLSGLPSSQSMTEQQTLQPFAASTLVDPDVGQAQAVRVALGSATQGRFSNLGGFADNGDGSYSFTGSAGAATTALRGLVFTPALHQAVPGGTTTATLTVSMNDGVAVAQTASGQITVQAVETAPTLAGTTASSVTSAGTVKPFAGVMVADPDKGAAEAVTIRLDDTAKGSFTTLAGFVQQADGSYSFSGTPAAAQAALQGLVFTPTPGRLASGTSEVATFTVTVSDGMQSVADASTKVTISSAVPNTAPTLTGLVTPQSMSELQTMQLFAGATLVDPDSTQAQSVKISLDSSSNGVFSNLGGFVKASGSTYTFAGTAAAATTALRGLVYEPADHLATPGTSSTQKFTISYSDGVASSKSTSISLSVLAVNTPPAISGAATLNTTDLKTVKPFGNITVTDPDKSATETATITPDDTAAGRFTTLAGFTAKTDGSYVYTGTRSNVQSALRSLVYTPTSGVLASGTSETVTFSLSVSDGMASAFDNATKVIISGTKTA